MHFRLKIVLPLLAVLASGCCGPLNPCTCSDCVGPLPLDHACQAPLYHPAAIPWEAELAGSTHESGLHDGVPEDPPHPRFHPLPTKPVFPQPVAYVAPGLISSAPGMRAMPAPKAEEGYQPEPIPAGPKPLSPPAVVPQGDGEAGSQPPGRFGERVAGQSWLFPPNVAQPLGPAARQAYAADRGWVR